jgi:hypothetical protein
MTTKKATKNLRQFIAIEDMSDWWGVTLTMKQGVSGEYLDEIKSSQNFKHFMNLLNKAVYGNAYQRFKKKIEVIPVLEWSPTERLHYHIAIKNPLKSDPLRFHISMIECWNLTRWSHRENKVDHQINSGWLEYITKEKSKNEIDWDNFHRVC